MAGGILEHGFYFDTHAHPVSEDVFALLGALFAHMPDVPVILERDADFGAFEDLRAELDRVRALRPNTSRIDLHVGSRPADAVAPPAEDARLSQLQEQVAALLIDVEPPAGDLAERIGLSNLARARAILQRKRVDDALPLLGRLARSAEALRPIAERTMEIHARLPRGAGPADAWHIAQAAVDHPHLRNDALTDRLILRARFRGPDRGGMLQPRWEPFFGSELLSDGRRLSAFKGFGALAPVRLHERRPTWPTHSQRSPQRFGDGLTS